MSQAVDQPLPWHAELWQRVQARRRSDQLPHALLLCGVAGLGKLRFANALAHSLVCAQPNAQGIACGTCSPCRLFLAGSHPDILRVAPEEEGKSISIEQIRALRELNALSSYGGGHKLVVIEPAERMTMAAANALLKTLEEPSGKTLIMLVTMRPSSLPATVRSRCQRLDFTVPARAAGAAWLQQHLGACTAQDAAAVLALAQGAPLRALQLHEDGALEQRAKLLADLRDVALGKSDPVVIAERWHKAGMKQAWQWLSSCVNDMLRLKFDASPSLLNNIDVAPLLDELARKADVQALFRWSDRVKQAQQEADVPLNQQMVLEDVLIAWERQFVTVRESSRPTP